MLMLVFLHSRSPAAIIKGVSAPHSGANGAADRVPRAGEALRRTGRRPWYRGSASLLVACCEGYVEIVFPLFLDRILPKSFRIGYNPDTLSNAPPSTDRRKIFFWIFLVSRLDCPSFARIFVSLPPRVINSNH